VTPAAVALAWLGMQRSVAAPIAGAQTVRQLTELLQAAFVGLTPQELKQLSRPTAPVPD
jgi:aryl-alcohol dehydrogenase-like predicted oxidoreductase